MGVWTASILTIVPLRFAPKMDEDMCRPADTPDWIKRRRKVAKKAAKGEAQGRYFTVAMLKQDAGWAMGGGGGGG
jgi:hypothetical protein